MDINGKNSNSTFKSTLEDEKKTVLMQREIFFKEAERIREKIYWRTKIIPKNS